MKRKVVFQWYSLDIVSSGHYKSIRKMLADEDSIIHDLYDTRMKRALTFLWKSLSNCTLVVARNHPTLRMVDLESLTIIERVKAKKKIIEDCNNVLKFFDDFNLVHYSRRASNAGEVDYESIKSLPYDLGSFLFLGVYFCQLFVVKYKNVMSKNELVAFKELNKRCERIFTILSEQDVVWLKED